MNRKANLVLNSMEFILFTISFIGINLYLYYNNLSLIGRFMLLFMGSVTGLLFISIECFLFILLEPKVRFTYIGYMILDIILTVFLTIQFPFYGLLVFFFFCILKNILRVVLVNKIYIPREFNYYCRMFGIKVKDFKKKKTVVRTTKKKEYIEIPVETTTEEKPKRSRKTAKSLEESA